MFSVSNQYTTEMIVDGYIVNINVMCTVNIRGHEANFYEARPDAMRPERVRLRLNDLASRPHGPRGLNIPGTLCQSILCSLLYHVPMYSDNVTVGKWHFLPLLLKTWYGSRKHDLPVKAPNAT